MITIQDSPAKFTPAFNPVYFKISSSNYAQPDFKYVADVYSGSGQLLASLKYQPQQAGSQPIDIDVSRMLQELVAANYCKLNAAATPDIVLTGSGLLSAYSVQFGEQYGGVMYANQVSFSGYVYNAVLNNKRFAFYNQAVFLNNRFLTGFQRQVARKSDSLIVSILQSDVAAMASFAFEIFNNAGTSIHSENIPNPYISLVLASNRALHLHCGFSYLFARLGFDLADYNAAAYYTITPPGGTPFRVDLYSQCERFPGVRLFFLNEYGGFDSFNFMLADRRSYSTMRESYRRQPDNRRTGYDATSRRFEALTRNFNTEVTEKYKLTSDYLTDTEAALLVELLTSPLIYMQVDAAGYGGTGNVLIPVDVKTSTYDLKKTALDKMFNLELDLELTYQNYRQSI